MKFIGNSFIGRNLIIDIICKLHIIWETLRAFSHIESYLIILKVLIRRLNVTMFWDCVDLMLTFKHNFPCKWF